MKKIFKTERAAINAFRKFCTNEENIDIDFRRDVFAENEYGAYPTYRLDKAINIINAMFEFISKNNDDASVCKRYNTLMSLNKLKTTKLKTWIESILFNEFFAPQEKIEIDPKTGEMHYGEINV